MSGETYNLDRFVQAQQGMYEQVLRELRAAEKRTHWMWFIFPQVRGLGRSSTAQLYAISGLQEARAYLAHPTLGARLRECTVLVNEADGRSISEIFGSPDDLKFHSSMTLFAQAEGADSVFTKALQQHFKSGLDEATMQLLR